MSRDVKSLADALAVYDAAVRGRETAEAVYGEVSDRMGTHPDIDEIMDRVGAQEACMLASIAEKTAHSKLIDTLRAALANSTEGRSDRA